MKKSSILVLFLFHLSVFATKITIDADGGADFRSLDSALQVSENSGIYPDTFLFTGADQDEYVLQRIIDRLVNDSIQFISTASNPDSFPIINHTVGDLYNFFGRNKIRFEKLILTGTYQFNRGNSSYPAIFDRCVISGFKDSYFLIVEGNKTTSTIFTNCLFSNNSYSNGIFRCNLWGKGHSLIITNCTFDGNNKIFQQSTLNDSNFVFVNNIYSNGSSVFPDSDFKGFSSYCLTSETSVSSYGTGCKTGDAAFIVTTGRTKPSDWKIGSASPALRMGTLTGAPSIDIAGQTRGTGVTVGCWANVSLLPNITKHPDSLIVSEGKTAKFRVIAVESNLKYLWFRIGNTTDTLSRTDSLVIVADTLLNGALFYCVVSNSSDGVPTRPGLLTVVKKPRIIQNIKDTVVSEGQSLLLNVKATGLALSYQWYQNGAIIAGKTTDSLYIASVDTSFDKASIQCIVFNSFDTVRSANIEIKVIRNVAPVIMQQPVTLVIVKHTQRFSFSVEASGVPAPVFTWYKNGLVDSVRSGPVFTVTSATYSDSGTYQCVIKNVAGSVNSNIVTVKVVDTLVQYNPINLNGVFVDRTHVGMRITGFENIPRTVGPAPYVDTIGIWYTANKNPQTPDRNAVNRILIPISKFPTTQNLFDTLLTVNGGDSCFYYHFLAVPFWKSPEINLSFDTTKVNKVYMCNTDPLVNPLGLRCSTFTASDSVWLFISGLSLIKRDSIDKLIVTYGNQSLSYFRDTIKIASIGQGLDQFRKTYQNSIFNGDEATIVFTVKIRGILGNISPEESTTVAIGLKRPKNNAVLSVDRAYTDRIDLSWVIPVSDVVDSIRIWSGTEQVPLVYNPDTSKFSSQKIGGTIRSLTCSNLNNNVLYYFGLQLKRGVLWSTITEASRKSERTLIDTTRLKNKLTMRKPLFNYQKNTMVIGWTIDTIGSGKGPFQVSIRWAFDTYPDTLVSGANEKIIPMESISFSGSNSTELYLGDDQLFDTSYYFSMFMRRAGTRWSMQWDSAQARLDIQGAQWQEITYFDNNSDHANIFNHSFMIRKEKSYPSGALLNKDTIDLLTNLPVPDSQFIPLSKPFKFRYVSNTLPVELGYRYGSIPAGYTHKDIFLYEYFDGKWHVLDRVSIDTASRMLFTPLLFDSYGKAEHRKSPHIIMIDKIKPVVTFFDTTLSLDVMRDLLTRIQISDNVVNVAYRLMCAPLNKKLAVVDSGKTTSNTYPKTITTSYGVAGLSDLNSLRMLFIVSDGSHSDTFDISRQVNKSNESVTSREMRWVPVSTTTMLNQPAIENAFLGLCKDDIWKYDSIQFRLFYWDPLKISGEDSYIQYSGERPDLFRLVPGKVFWVKSRSQKSIQFGVGKTVSILEPFKIVLQPKKWVDFSLPFNISLYIEDIFDRSPALSNTLRDSIWFYQFDASIASGALTCTPLYFPAISKYRSTMAVLKNEMLVAYSLYNASDKKVELIIPPIDTVNSLQSKVITKTKPENEWYISINAEAEDECIAPVFCGYKFGGVGVSTYPSPPAPGSVKVYTCDTANLHKWGNVIYHEDRKGFTYPILFSNSSKSVRKQVSYTVNTNGLGEQSALSTAIYNSETNQLEPITSGLSVSLAPGENVYRWVLVGDASYFAGWISEFKNAPFELLKVSSVHGRSLHFQFNIPYNGVSSVRLRIFSPSGREVWNQTRSGLIPGKHSLSVENLAVNLSSGCYIIQLSGYDGDRNLTKTLKSKFLYLPR